MELVPKGRGPFREAHAGPGWRVHVHAAQGAVRRRMEDAWRVLPSALLAGRRVLVAGVFDGLGGMPRGQEAAWAAAEMLQPAVATAAGPDDLLALLNRAVLEARGTTTAAIAIVPHDSPQTILLGVGDSSAYAMTPDGPRPLLAHDATGPTTLTDFLGNPDMKGRRMDLDIPPGGRLLLCTDGVAGVVDGDAVADALTPGTDDGAAALKQLLDRVEAAGSPDNATAILLERTG